MSNEEKSQYRTSNTSSDATRPPSSTMGSSPPPIHFNLWREKKWNILLYWITIIFCNLALPCIIYYPIRTLTTLSLQDAIGAGSASLGVSAIFEFPVRLWKLWFRRDIYGPLNDDTRWHLDSFMFAYTIAMMVASVPLAVAPALDPPLISFFLMFTAMLVGQMALNMAPTLFKFRTPIWISSDPPGTRIKPAVFYMVEDICAVDAGKGREFRREWNARYDASPPFQRLMYKLTVFWVFGACVYVGVTAAVTFTTTVDFAYAYTLGQLFIWILVWIVLTWIWVHFALKWEHEWWAEQFNKTNGAPKEQA